MAKKIVTSYTFDASAKTINSADFTLLEKIQLITNVTDQVIIYNFADTAKGGSLSGTTLTLEYDTTSMDDADKLQIFIDDGIATATLTEQETQTTSLLVSEGYLGSIDSSITSQATDIANTQINTANIDNKTPYLGQALEAASVPVVLPAAQLSTLTPPAAITGFATAAKQDALLAELQLKADLTETQPVSLATVPSHPVTNAGTFAVQVTSAPTTAVTGTFWQATQPVSATSLPLPTGASTAAKQPALGTAGTASSDVITVQGIASMTPIKTDGSGVTQPVSGTVTANLGTIADVATQTTLAAINTKLVSGTDIGDVTINNASGASAVNIQDGGNSITVDGTVAATQSGTWTTGHNITGIGTGRTTVTTAGTRVVLAASTACKKVDITAETDNTGVIVVGGTGVVASLATRQGTPLNAGDTYSIEIDNLNDINIDSTVSTEGVTYTYYT